MTNEHLRQSGAEVFRGPLYLQQHMTPSLCCSGFTLFLKPGGGPKLRTIALKEDDQRDKDRKGKSTFCADLTY